MHSKVLGQEHNMALVHSREPVLGSTSEPGPDNKPVPVHNTREREHSRSQVHNSLTSLDRTIQLLMTREQQE